MKIYNSLTRRKEDFKPIKDGRVGMYVCGPTVYDEPHIGHARSAYIFEVIRNYLEYKGYKVIFVKNITDVDDKIIEKARQELPGVDINEAVKKIAEKYTQEYYHDMDELGIRRATFAPKATEHIEQMKDYIARLLKKKFAYESDGDVYFDVRAFKDYGELSHQNLDQMRSTARVEEGDKKRDILDFALWKKSKEDEPCWRSPWGKGRPGWHIECSVMASIYLGDEFDIHAGGRDLIFPHHENEIAQSRCYSGKGFARIWIHNGLLTIKGQKMAKSLGNFISVKDFLKENIPQVLKFFFLSCHYRSPIDFNERKIQEAKSSYERIQILFDRLDRKFSKAKIARKCNGLNEEVIEFKKDFIEAMDDDFNTPEALASLFELVTYCNKLLDDYKEEAQPALSDARNVLCECLNIFGVIPGKIPEGELSSDKIEELIKTRQELREKGNFAEADRIRKILNEKGVILEDTREGTVWRRRI